MTYITIRWNYPLTSLSVKNIKFVELERPRCPTVGRLNYGNKIKKVVTDTISISIAPRFWLILRSLRNTFFHTVLSCWPPFFKQCFPLVSSSFDPLSANPTTWSNTLKLFVGKSRRIVRVCLTILLDWRLKS